MPTLPNFVEYKEKLRTEALIPDMELTNKQKVFRAMLLGIEARNPTGKSMSEQYEAFGEFAEMLEDYKSKKA